MSLCKKQFSQERTINIAIIGFVYSIIFNLETHHVSHVFCTKKRVPSPKLKFHPRKRVTVLIFYIPQIFLKKKHPNENPNAMITASLQGLSKEDRGKACRAEDQGESRQRPSHAAGGAIRQSSNVENP